ncbi:MAG: 3-keto-5-aminohexanoate cleavage protein [Pseudomonadota bacterium]
MTPISNSLTPPGQLILGVARTGAKFTPLNHKPTGDPVFDMISSGAMIPVTPDEIRAEMASLYHAGVRYIHEHARNPATREQSAEPAIYKSISAMAREVAPDALLSFGGSRNGQEIASAIKTHGEIARVAHAGLDRDAGGADFVTTQAAIELQIVLDMERQGFIRIKPQDGSYKVLRPLHTYEPSGTVEEARLAVNSTAGGANYGSSSAWIQYETAKWTIDARERLGLPYEVEWVQEARSAFLTWYLANHMPEGLRRIGRLNITLLFGFSPRLPFPKSYAAFKRLVEKAKRIANPVWDEETRPLHVSVSVGCAVLPQHAKDHVLPVDVGPLRGVVLGPLERLAIYAAQPNAGVDILRVGLEDTPYVLDDTADLMPTTNLDLVWRTRGILDTHGTKLVTDMDTLTAFKSVPGGPGQ